MAEPPIAAETVHDTVPLPLGTSVYIRVIKIRPSAVADSSDRIACDFSIIDVNNGSLYHLATALPLSGSVQYTALSYMWGAAIADHTIDLNGTPFLVRKNLWTFLDRARTDGFEGYLWIDALCIDQTRVGERNHQVALMGNIYSHAEGVIVWLGHVCEDIENAITAISGAYAPEKLPLSAMAQHTSGIQRFCQLEYWRRAWIVQEYVLARKIEVWSTNIKFEGRTVGWLHAEARRFTPVWYIRPEDPPAMRIIQYRQERLKRLAFQEKSIRRSLGSEDAHVELYNLLKRFRADMVCADAKDRVYALLSLLSPEGRTKLSIIPDYTKTASELFTGVVCSYAQLRLSPQEQEKLSADTYATESDLQLLERILSCDWKGYRRNLLVVIASLQLMLSFDENEVVVQNVLQLIDDALQDKDPKCFLNLSNVLKYESAN